MKIYLTQELKENANITIYEAKSPRNETDRLIKAKEVLELIYYNIESKVDVKSKTIEINLLKDKKELFEKYLDKSQIFNKKKVSRESISATTFIGKTFLYNITEVLSFLCVCKDFEGILKIIKMTEIDKIISVNKELMKRILKSMDISKDSFNKYGIVCSIDENTKNLLLQEGFNIDKYDRKLIIFCFPNFFITKDN